MHTNSTPKTFYHRDLKIFSTDSKSKARQVSGFGSCFGDYMFLVDWNVESGWDYPAIVPFGNLDLSPACAIFHYSIGCFEGLKAYKNSDGQVFIFRPYDSAKRMIRSAIRCGLPTFDEKEFVECLKTLVKMESESISSESGMSLYIRPTFISTTTCFKVSIPTDAKLFIVTSPVGSYYANGAMNPISLFASTHNIRSWPGGTGSYKMSCNYAPTILPLSNALEMGCDQTLWLFDNRISEAGTMNIFIFWKNKQDQIELITPPLDGTILPGITRDSVLTICRKWDEFKVSEDYVTIDELDAAVNESRIFEIFGTGTAASISPIGKIIYDSRTINIPCNSKNEKQSLASKLYQHINKIQTGIIESNWAVKL